MEIYTIGKEPSNRIQLPNNDHISRFHAKLEVRDNNSYVLYDQSTNGTFINGVMIKNDFRNVSRGDIISFAGIAVLDWRMIPERKKNGFLIKWWHIALPFFIVLIGISVYLFMNRPSIKPVEAPQLMGLEDISAKYDKSVGMLVHAYFLKIPIGQRTMFFGRSKKTGDLDIDSNRENLNPFMSIGTAFLVKHKNKVKLITNRHVVDPSWRINQTGINDLSQERNLEINEDQELIRFARVIREIIHHYKKAANLYSYNNELFVTQKAFMKFVPKGQMMQLQDHMTLDEISVAFGGINCSLAASSINEDVDLAELNVELPYQPGKFSYINLSDISSEETKIGTDVFMIGYPGGTTLAYDKVTRQSNPERIKGQISREPSKFFISYQMNTLQGSSGSPVFDSRGKLVGINYAGWAGLSRGMAIKSNYLLRFLEGDWAQEPEE
ncbi:trypsin-like peptidase domain-containing protein [Haliscomenobacter sp.]|uniref:trypsin-like peptidase domain-containing protein n=1 Tax=Haliscomenobacter sp. TaxID=2717303 RepID=UPI003BAC639D